MAIKKYYLDLYEVPRGNSGTDAGGMLVLLIAQETKGATFIEKNIDLKDKLVEAKGRIDMLKSVITSQNVDLQR